MVATREYMFSRSSACRVDVISNSYMTGGMWSNDSPATSKTLSNTVRSMPSAVSWMRCRSMTAAESLLMGRGVLLTTTRNTHCSQLQVVKTKQETKNSTFFEEKGVERKKRKKSGA